MHTLRVLEDPISLSFHDQDARHKNSDRIHQLMKQIRTLPGQERFVKGLSSDELAQCASHNAVVVLIASEGECHGLILQPDDRELVTLELSNITSSELTAMVIAVSASQRRGVTPDNVCDEFRGMKVSSHQTSLHQTSSDPILEKLWTTVVKPVIDCLNLQVRDNDADLSIIST
jgi:hypothetical protein